ncbi:MAG: PEP-CTERM sorting domain-containing protein [Myxococcota bacterium]
MDRFGAISFVRRAVGFGLAAAFASWVGAPMAAALPAVGLEIDLGGMTFDQPGAYVLGNVATEVSLSPTPTVHVHEDGIGGGAVTANYFFRVEGPIDGTPVPIEIDGTVEIDAKDVWFYRLVTWEAFAGITAVAFDSPFSPDSSFVSNQSAWVTCSPDSATSLGPQSQAPPLASCAATHQQQQVNLQLHSLTGADNLVTLNAWAYNFYSDLSSLDSRITGPIIRFAPGFDSTGYRIVLSDGVGNGSVVPEPGTAILFGGGLMILAGRRRADGRSS